MFGGAKDWSAKLRIRRVSQDVFVKFSSSVSLGLKEAPVVTEIPRKSVDLLYTRVYKKVADAVASSQKIEQDRVALEKKRIGYYLLSVDSTNFQRHCLTVVRQTLYENGPIDAKRLVATDLATIVPNEC